MAKLENVAYKRSQRTFFGRELLGSEKPGLWPVEPNPGRNAAPPAANEYRTMSAASGPRLDRGACVKKTSNRHAVRKMKEGPSEPPCRRRPQTAISCFGPKTEVVNVMVKRRGGRSRHVWIREMSANDPLRKHRKPINDTQNQGLHHILGTAWKVPTYWPCGVRCLGGMTLIRAFVRNLRTGSVMLTKGKGTSGHPTRPKVPMHRSGAHCFVRAMKRGNARGAKGAGHPGRDGVNGQPEELLVLMEGGSLLWVARAG
jgi:hypothetical protein